LTLTLSIIFRCDGDRDCPHGEDELNCLSNVCSDDQFRCDNGQCISVGKKCNGNADCSDESDEIGCELRECDEGNTFAISIRHFVQWILHLV
jgi:hypothetical protein